jgi:hypothetical protein
LDWVIGISQSSPASERSGVALKVAANIGQNLTQPKDSDGRNIVWEITPELHLQGMVKNTSSAGNNCCLNALGSSLTVPPAAARIYLTECFTNLDDYDLDKIGIVISLLSNPDKFKSREALFKATTKHLQNAGYLSAEILALALQNDKLKPDSDRIFTDAHFVFLKETTNRTIVTRQCEVLNSTNQDAKEFVFVLCDHDSTHFESCVFPQVTEKHDFQDLYLSFFGKNLTINSAHHAKANGSEADSTADAQMKLNNSNSYSTVASNVSSLHVEWDSEEEEDLCWTPASKDINRALQILPCFDMQELREIQALHRKGNLFPPRRLA